MQRNRVLRFSSVVPTNRCECLCCLKETVHPAMHTRAYGHPHTHTQRHVHVHDHLHARTQPPSHTATYAHIHGLVHGHLHIHTRPPTHTYTATYAPAYTVTFTLDAYTSSWYKYVLYTSWCTVLYWYYANYLAIKIFNMLCWQLWRYIWIHSYYD